ncbi:related to DNA repair protein UVS-2 [Phialocephala subalpina]|uniref:Postreplication repair E3 ubiquitin-protein ligase RAD18 n=1 Tax=Phialocephala subalpina TaxID=576137 RepID=A0A1L7XE37_9HELO|nr:related to DNA repair protein UVS-2 [Phialocephala subalpina]
MDRASKDDAFEVTDSTDWLDTPMKSLAGVDAALRCQVCRDFYSTPMITSCSHTFCSLCIRRSLNNDGKCPACRSPEQEMKLRNNNAMEDLVEAFKRGRADILAFARIPAIPVAPTRKRSLEQAEEDVEDSSPKRRRSGRTKSSSQTKSSQKATVVADSDGDSDYSPEDGTVECPICQRRVKETGINKHIDDGCPDELQAFPHITKPGSSRTGSGYAKSSIQLPEKAIKRPERLPQLNYSTTKDNVLKKKLTDAGLSAGGNRQLLEKRYKEWITLWNANCDATKPKSKGELKRELEIWERTQGGRATASSSTQMGAIIRDKEFDRDAWSGKHNDDFKQLIANAKRKAQAKKSENTSSANTPAESAGTATPDVAPTTPDVVIGDNGNDDPILIEDTPEKPASQKRFFDESNSDPPPSSQYQSKLGVLDKDAGLASDITTIRSVQP